MASARKSRSRWSKRPALALWLAAAVATGTVQADERESWYLAARNHLETGLSVMIVTLDDGSQWIRVTDLKLLDIPLPAMAPRTHAGESILPLSSLTLGTDIDSAGGRLHLLDPGPPVVSTETEDLVLDITANGQALAEAQVARRAGDTIWLSKDTLSAARFRVPVEVSADGWIPVRALAGEHYVFDAARMRLEISTDPERFELTRLHAGGEGDEASPGHAPAPLAAIVGYDVATGRDVAGSRYSSLLLDTAVSKGRTSCRSGQLWRTDKSWSRLESNCYADWPEHRLSLVLGDAISRDSSLSGAVRYGGIRIGTDFGLQPHLRTQPMLGVEGSARLPSILEVWIEQKLALRTELPPGEFLLDGVPAQSGRGEINAVITDALGRRTLVSTPFYSDPNLLRTDLTDWSLEFGRLRQNFLGADDQYGDPFGLFTWRRGLSSFWTLETRAEWQPTHRLLGLANYLKLGQFGVLELSAARSQDQAMTGGGAFAAGYSYQGQRLSAGVRYAAYDEHYQDLAYPLAGTAPARDAQANAGIRLGRVSLSAGAVLRDRRGADQQRLVRAAASLPLGPGYLSLSAFRSMQPISNVLYTAIYTLPLGREHSMAAWVNGGDGALNPGFSVQRSLPAGPGYGYRLAREESPFGARSSVNATVRGSTGETDAAIFQTAEGTDARIGTRGALIASGEGIFLAPDDGGSFAVVTMPQPGARILREHQFAAVTNDSGKAVIPKLRPFERNRLDVETESLDTSSRLSNPALDLVPGRRQVVRADFGASRANPLTLRVETKDGLPIPAGATAQWAEQPVGPVGYDGLLYLEMTGKAKAITIEWQSQSCRIPADALPAVPDPSQTYSVTCL
jgi:outer membrane usher protein